jgi:hypothetical protein
VFPATGRRRAGAALWRAAEAEKSQEFRTAGLESLRYIVTVFAQKRFK